MTPTPKELPDLPNLPGAFLPRGFIGLVKEPVFTSAQMQAYAREAVAASLQGIERDAARYRFLRDKCTAVTWTQQHGGYKTTNFCIRAGLLEMSVDAAMKDAP